MRIKFLIGFTVAVCLLSFSKTKAQTVLQGDKIPDDFLIVLKKQECCIGATYSEMTITATGDISYQSRGGFPVTSPSNLLYLNKKGKLSKFLKPKVSGEKLRALITEFEKIQFFRFGKDFPQEDETDLLPLNHQASETISIRINGQTKEVYNYLGDPAKRTSSLRNLAERIRGAGIWNFEGGEIPENFQVRYQITDGDKIQREFKIEANGDIVGSFYTSVPSKTEKEKFVLRLDKSKVVAKVSKQQIRNLIDEFEKAVFSTFKYSTLSEYDGCSNAPVATAKKGKHISVQINYVLQMYASLYENCNAKPETDAAKFEYAADAIEKLLKNVGAIKAI